MKAVDWQHFHHVAMPAVRGAKDREVFEDAAVEMGEFEGTGRVDDKLLEVLAAACRAKSSIVRSFGADWLFGLVRNDSRAEKVLRDLFAGESAATRLSIIQSVPHASPDLTRDLLLTALQDASAEVRLFAAHRIDGLFLRQLIPSLRSALAVEKDPSTRRSMEHSLAYLEDGYRREPSTDADSELFWVRYRRGYTGTSIPTSTIAALGADEVALRIRLRADWPGPSFPGNQWDPIADPNQIRNNGPFDADLLTARKIMADFEDTGEVATERIETLIAIVRNRHSNPQTLKHSAAWLVATAAKSKFARDAILHLFKTTGAEVRTALMQSVYVSHTFERDFDLSLLSMALRDSEPLISHHAAIRVQEHRYFELVDSLSAVIEQQQGQQHRQKLSESLELLNIGFTCTEAGKRHFTLKVALPRGVTVVKVPKAVVNEIGATEISRRIAARREWQGKRPAGKPWDPVPPINREPLRRERRLAD